jgi:hypothetical protein
LMASEQEVQENPRSRSAKLRIAQKLWFKAKDKLTLERLTKALAP